MPQDPRELTAEALEAQTRSLRQLARGLVGDEHRVDDVVQEAWVTALQKPARRGFSLGSWLAGITRNHARDEMRSQRRRDARERLAARPEGVPVDDALDRLDTLRDLLDHVRRLDEPHRSVLLRRFVDGQSARRIAKQDGLPVATVRTRIARGLGKLRDRLDRAHGDDRRAWLVPLVPLAAGPQGGLPAPIADGLTNLAGTLGLGAAGMSAKTQVGVCATALAGALVTLFVVYGDTGELDREGPADAEPTIASATADPIEQADEGTPPTRAPVEEFENQKKLAEMLASLPRAYITGVVRDDQGEPVVGATIEGHGEPVTTDADGIYTTEGTIVAMPTRQSMLRASAPGHARVRKTVHLTNQSTEVRVDITLPKGFVIHGKITDATGAPVVGAKVTTFYASEFVVETDANGEYRLDRLDPGRPKHMVYARAEGWLEAKANVATKSTDVEQDFVMHPGSSVRGVLRDPNGAPVAGAAMFIGDSPYSYDKLEAKSDAAGGFAFPTVPPGSRTLVTQIPGFAADIRKIEVPRAGGVLEVEIELDPGHTLSGQVVDQSGQPIASAHLHMQHRGMAIDRRGSTDENGRFSIEALPDEALQVRCYRRGFVDATVRQLQVDRELKITMQPIGKIAGIVVDKRTGAPIEAFTIRFVQPDLRPGEHRGGGYDATWAREGFSFSSAEGTWDTGDETLAQGFLIGIEACAEGYAPGVVRRVFAKATTSPEDLRIELEPGTRLVGKVLTDDTGAPVANALVKVARAHNPVDTSDSDDTHGRAMTRTDDRGEFAFDDIAAGELHLVIQHPDWGIFVHRVDVTHGFETLEETVRLDRQGTIIGTARDETGHLIAGAKIRARAIEVPGIDRHSHETTTDPDGRYALSNLPAGAYLLSMRDKVGRHTIDRWGRYVQIDGHAERTIDLAPDAGPGRISGRVQGDPSLPAMLRISLRAKSSYGVWEERIAPRATVSRDGAFEFRGLEVGTYRVWLRHFDRPTMTMHEGQVEVDVDASGETTVSLNTTPRKLG